MVSASAATLLAVSQSCARLRDRAFGVLAIVGWGLLLFAALEPFTSVQALKALVAAGATSRLAILVQGFGARPARGDGLGAGFSVSLVALAISSVATAAIVLAAAGLADGAVSLGAGVIAAVLVTLFVRRAFGGRTGDTLGARRHDHRAHGLSNPCRVVALGRSDVWSRWGHAT